MAFGFPAQFSDTRSLDFAQNELSKVVETAFNNLGWQYQIVTDNEFQAKVSLNALSWGEKLTVRLLANGELQAESKCVYPLQCFDWGKNKENV